MSAYLFTGSITQVRTKSSCGSSGCCDAPQIADSCVSQIVYGGSAEAAQSGFEAWVRRNGEANQVSTNISKIVVAPMMDQLFTEAGFAPIDWSKISEQMQTSCDGIAVDDFEQGYWVDANQILNLEKLSPDLASLQRDLDEDISSGLNWAAEKQFFFLLSALTPPPAFTYETETEDSTDTKDEDAYESDMENAEAQDATFPEMAGKEAAALIQARNSAVAVWLWRRYAADTRLAGNQIRIDPWCGALGLEPGVTA